MRYWIKIGLGVLVFSMVCTILFISNTTDNEMKINKPVVSITYKGEDAILTEGEVLYRLKRKKMIFENQTCQELEIEAVENFLNNMPEVRTCEVFKEYGSNWNIKIELRRLIARVIDRKGDHFFIDDQGYLIKRRSNIVARVPVFIGSIPIIYNEGHINDLINKDSLISNNVLKDIYTFSNYVCDNPFLSALITQIQIDSKSNFEIIPGVGDCIIKFGSVENEDNIKDKMFRLETFYKKGLPYEGWEKYKEINLSYDGQIVCRKR